ncbi:MAG: kelch repeat-containing protein [Candidatus Brocadiia bacterium]
MFLRISIVLTAFLLAGCYVPVDDSHLFQAQPKSNQPSVPNAPPARIFQSAVWDGEKFILFGGDPNPADGLRNFYNDLWWYYPKSDTWVRKIAQSSTGSPSARKNHTMVWDGQRVIMFGGWDGTAYKNDLWWYDPETNTWTQKLTQDQTGSPTGRFDHSMVWAYGQAIMFAGWDSTERNVNDLWSYDPDSNKWTQKVAKDQPGSPPPRRLHDMAWIGDRIIMFGGYTDTDLNDLWHYNPDSNKWVQKVADGQAGVPARRRCYSLTWDGSRIILFGGYNTGVLGDLWWYNPDSNAWVNKINGIDGEVLPKRHGHSMGWTGRAAVMIAGADQSLRNDVWSYDPATNSWTRYSIGK